MEDIGANIGEMLAIAMAEGGQSVANAACRYTNMTDACCIAGVKWPKNISKEEKELLIWFDNETKRMLEWNDERAEEARYCLVGDMLVKIVEGEEVSVIREHVVRKLKTIRRDVERLYRSAKVEHYDDRYGFDENSPYLRENNWGDKQVYDEMSDRDWWTRRAG